MCRRNQTLTSLSKLKNFPTNPWNCELNYWLCFKSLHWSYVLYDKYHLMYVSWQRLPKEKAISTFFFILTLILQFFYHHRFSQLFWLYMMFNLNERIAEYNRYWFNCKCRLRLPLLGNLLLRAISLSGLGNSSEIRFPFTLGIDSHHGFRLKLLSLWSCLSQILIMELPRSRFPLIKVTIIFSFWTMFSSFQTTHTFGNSKLYRNLIPNIFPGF